jgi:nucleoside-diphosphate-sugar epimerase
MRTLLIIGFGDIAQRCMPRLRRHWQVLALVRTGQQAEQARTLGATPIRADLDHAASLQRLAGLADAMLYTAPPPASGARDTRLQQLLAALSRSPDRPQQLVYISTSGVYGNHHGDWISESASTAAGTPRAHRRLDAEQQLRALARRWACSVTILRAPGIYAAERLPLERIRQQLPVPVESAPVYTNHIHADDLARICVQALQRSGGIRIYNASDQQPLPVSDWFDALADHFGLSRPPRLDSAGLAAVLTPLQRSFLNESRRLSNARLLRELMPRLQYPSIQHFLATQPAAPPREGMNQKYPATSTDIT